MTGTTATQALIAAIIQNGAPLLMAWIQSRHADTGTFPTNEEVIAKFYHDADRYITEGEDELRAKGIIA